MNQVQIQILPEEKNLLLFIQPKNKETENEQLSIKPQSITGRSDRSTTTRRLQVSAENVPDHVSVSAHSTEQTFTSKSFL